MRTRRPASRRRAEPRRGKERRDLKSSPVSGDRWAAESLPLYTALNPATHVSVGLTVIVVDVQRRALPEIPLRPSTVLISATVGAHAHLTFYRGALVQGLDAPDTLVDPCGRRPFVSFRLASFCRDRMHVRIEITDA